MSKSYAEYSATRRAGLTGADAVAVDVFDRAYALGAALAEARRERGLKQRELAEISGVDQGDISRIERGVLAPTTPTLLRLVEGLNARITLELLPT
jgi:ribosome-binding protein aMBF1 (putative translation factor)